MSDDFLRWLVTPRYERRDVITFAFCFAAGMSMGALLLLVLMT